VIAIFVGSLVATNPVAELPFCGHDPPRLAFEEVRFCEFAEDFEATCPGMVIACARAKAEGVRSSNQGDGVHSSASAFESDGDPSTGTRTPYPAYRGESGPGEASSPTARSATPGSHSDRSGFPADSQRQPFGEVSSPRGGASREGSSNSPSANGLDGPSGEGSRDGTTPSNDSSIDDFQGLSGDRSSDATTRSNGRSGDGADGPSADGSRNAPTRSNGSSLNGSGGPSGDGSRDESMRSHGDSAAGSEPEPNDLEPQGLSQAGWIVLGLLLAGLVALVVRQILRGRRPRAVEDSSSAEALPASPSSTPSAEPLHIVETEVERLMRMARASEQGGQHERAIDFAYAALLRRLAGDGLIVLGRSRTNGDHVRALASQPRLQTQVRAVLTDIEAVHFGANQARGACGGILARVTSLVGTTVRPLASLVLLCSLFNCDLASDDRSIGGSTRGFRSSAPLGSKAVIDLLTQHGISVSHHTGPLPSLFESDDPIVVMAGATPTEDEWTQLMAWVNGGGTLVIATGPGHVPPESGTWSFFIDHETSAILTATSPWARAMVVESPALARLEPSAEGPLHTLLERGGDLYAAEFQVGDGTTVVFADDYLLTNAALPLADNARFIERCFDELDGNGRTVRVIDTWTGRGAQTPMDAIARTHLTPVIAQGLLLLALVYLSRGTFFGRPRDPAPRPRRALVERVRALGAQYARIGAGDRVLELYSAWCVERLCATIPGGDHMALHELAEELALRSGRRPAQIYAVLGRAQGVIPLRTGEALNVIEQLRALLLEIGGPR